MTQPAKSQEPSMEEILASIRRIIADDDASKPSAKPPDASKAASRAASSRTAAGMPVAPPAVEPDPAPSEVEPDSDDARNSGVQDPDILDLTESMTASAFAEPALTPEPPRISRPVRMPEPAPVERVESHSESVEAPSEPEPEAILDDITEVEDDLSFAAATVDSSEPESFAEGARVGVPGVSERGQLLSGATSAAVDSAFNALAQTVLVQNARTLEDLVREMLRPMLKTWLDDNLPGLVERLVRSEIERVARGR
jgi:uncharacterized protein